MGQRSNDVAALDAQTILRKEEYATDMEQRSKKGESKGSIIDMNALPMDVQTKYIREVCASGTGQRSNVAALKDAHNVSSREEFALDTGHRSNDAAAKDVQTYLREEVYVSSMGQGSSDVAA